MRNKIFALMAVSLVVLCSTLAIYIGAFTLRPMARDAAMTSAMTGIARSVEMFMVSTKKFNAEFEQASSKQDKDAVRETWTTTIRAVDDAVIHDFGPDNLRVRLVNDPAITGIPSSGGTATAVETDFERKALQQFIDGRNEPIVTEEDGFLKISAPLPASAHPGCANCHDLPVGSKTVLGSINAYAPLKSAIAKSDSALGASEGTARVTNAMEELVGAANLTTVASGNVASVATELVSANEDLASTVETFLRSVVASR